MTNLSYCRFQNTAKDLKDCVLRFTDELTVNEHNARMEIVSLCEEIIELVDGGDGSDLAVELVSDDEELE